jgi:hypothetical protein
MTKRFLLTVGLVLLWGLALTAAQAGESSCCGNTCAANGGCDSCRQCCPHCGCKMVPQCNITCTTKKETSHKYTCKCDAICIPGITPWCKGSAGGDKGGSCGDSCGNGCGEGCGSRSMVRQVHKLAKVPATKEVPVRTCTAGWNCPNCGCGGQCESGAAAAPGPVSPSPAPAAPAPKLPAAPKAPSPKAAPKQAQNLAPLPDMR